MKEPQPTGPLKTIFDKAVVPEVPLVDHSPAQLESTLLEAETLPLPPPVPAVEAPAGEPPSDQGEDIPSAQWDPFSQATERQADMLGFGLEASTASKGDGLGIEGLSAEGQRADSLPPTEQTHVKLETEHDPVTFQRALPDNSLAIAKVVVCCTCTGEVPPGDAVLCFKAKEGSGKSDVYKCGRPRPHPPLGVALAIYAHSSLAHSIRPSSLQIA